MVSLLTIEEFKDLPVGLKDQLLAKVGDTNIQFYLDAAADQVEGVCKRYIAARVIDETLEGKDDRDMLLSQNPVISLTSAYTVSATGAETAISNSLFSVLNASGIVRWVNPFAGTFMRDHDYRFVYTAGYSPVPLSIQLATAIWAVDLMSPIYGVRRTAADSEASSAVLVDLLTKYRRDRIR